MRDRKRELVSGGRVWSRWVGLLALFTALTLTPLASYAGHLVVRTSDLVNGAVTTPKLRDRAVRPAKIANGAVTRPKIRRNAVSAAKIAAGAVTTDKISRSARGPAVAGASIAAGGSVSSFFNRFGDGMDVEHTPGTGQYFITFDGLEGRLFPGASVVVVSLVGSQPGMIARSLSFEGTAVVSTWDASGNPADRAFDLVVVLPSGP